LRNYINWGEPIILMGKTSGVQYYKEDFIAFNRLYSLIYVDVTPIFNSISLFGKDTITDYKILGTFQKELWNLNKMAFECGPSFYSRRNGINSRKDFNLRNNCKYEIINGYDNLRIKLIAKNGFFFEYKTAFSNLKKAVFKMNLTQQPTSIKDFFIYFSFSYRIVYIVLGLVSIFFLFSNKKIIIIVFPLFMIFFVAVVNRHVEIRYLAQAEAILILLATVTIYRLKYLKL
jgi:hypothetical protein